MLMSQVIIKHWQPEPKTILVESNPVKEGTKLSEHSLSWEYIRGLTWTLQDDDF